MFEANGLVPYPFAIIEQPWTRDIVNYDQELELYGTSLGFDYQIDYRLASNENENWHLLISTGGQILEGLIYTIPAYTFEPGNTYIIRLKAYYQNANDEIITDNYETQVTAQ